MFICAYPEQQLIEHLSTVLAAWQPRDLYSAAGAEVSSDPIEADRLLRLP